MSQIKKGAILSYLNISLNLVIGLLITPFIINTLGDSEYGLYTLIGSFVAYLSLMDFGLNNTILRFVSKYRAEKNLKAEHKFLGTTMLIYLVISFIIVIVGVLLYFNLDIIFRHSLTSSQLDRAKVMFVILVFNMAITLPGNSFTAICNAYEKFVFPRFLSILRYILRTITIVTVLYLGGRAISIVVIDTVFNILVIGITYYYSKSKLKVKFNYKENDWRIIRQILSYSIWIFLLAIISQFQWNIGQVILGIKVNTVEVAVYAIGIMLGSYYGAFSTAISGLFLPKASQMVLNNTNEELTDMMIKIGRLSIIPLLLILMGFFLFGKEFILLWVGEQYNDSFLIALLIMVAYTVPLVQSFAGSIVEAKNKVAFKVRVYSVFLFAGMFTGYFLIEKLGGVGMILGIVAGWLVAQIVMNVFFNNELKLDILRFYKEISLSFVLPAGLSLLIGFAINEIQGQGWTILLLRCVLFTVSYFILIWYLGINSSERKLLIRNRG